MGTAAQFETEMEELYEEMKAVLPRPPTTFLRMLKEHGGVEAARRLVDQEKPTPTFLKLIELGHPELTVESLVLKPQYSTLFSAGVKRRARQRLQT
jgi:hypothetical protein